MPEYTFRTETVEPGEDVEIPDNARDVSFHREMTEDGIVIHISYLDKHGKSVL